ncbi:MAG TPA: tetratricopeptide repeat protein [Gaiellaceae bacterium]|nr:tetratricopeptide repeat protein [Gaiellaceae bacterium]
MAPRPGRIEEACAAGSSRARVRSLEADWLWRQVQARVHAHRGEHGEAERLAREAIAIVERTDILNNQADALSDLAEVLAASDRGEDAAAALDAALERYERKKNLATIGQVRTRLEDLQSGGTKALTRVLRGRADFDQ